MKKLEPDLSECEHRIQYRFKNCELLKTALTHSSYANTHIESNERLEFLGDALLGLIVSNMLYRQFPLMTEGDLSKLKAIIVSRKTCKKIALQLGLERFLFIGKGLTSIPNSLIANVMESVIGAIFLDGGFDTVRCFVENNFQKEIDFFSNSEEHNIEKNINLGQSLWSNFDATSFKRSSSMRLVENLDDNYKAKLQTKVHREFPSLAPVYILLDEKGPDHSKCFKVAVKLGEQLFQAAWGKSKKEAEQHAAANAFEQLSDLCPPYNDGE